jgi:hypothetical protein
MPCQGRANYAVRVYGKYIHTTYLVSACSAGLTSAAENTWLHSYTITGFDPAHAVPDFEPTEIP